MWRASRWAVVVAVALGVTACGSSSKSSSSATAPPGVESAGRVANAAPAGGEAAPTSAPAAVDRSIIYTASLSVRTKDVAGAARDAVAAVERHGGNLFNQELTLGAAPRATLTLKVPPTELAATLDELSALGKVTDRGQQAQDVTAEVVDVDSRIKTGEASVVRLRDLIAKATSVTDIATLEAELARREADLESLKAKQRVLTGQVAQATITLHLAEPTTGSAVRRIPGIGSALAAGGKAFWTVLKAFLVALAWSLPFLGAAIAIGWPLRRILRRRARTPKRQHPPRRPMPGGPLPPPSSPGA